MTESEQQVYLRIETGFHTDKIFDLQATGDGKKIISSSADRTIRIWDRTDPSRGANVLRGEIGSGLLGHIRRLAVTPDDRYILTVVDGAVRADETLRVYEIASGRLVQTFKLPKGHVVSSITFSPDKRFMLISDYDRGVLDLFAYERFVALCATPAASLFQSDALHVSYHYPPLYTGGRQPHVRRSAIFKVAESYRIVAGIWDFQSYNHRLVCMQLDAAKETLSLEQEVSLGHFPCNIAINHQMGHFAVDVAVDEPSGQIRIYDFDWQPVETIDDTFKDVALAYVEDNGRLICAAGGVCRLYDGHDDYQQIKEWDVGKPDATALALLGSDALALAAGEEIAIVDVKRDQLDRSLSKNCPSDPLYGIGVAQNSIAFGTRPARKAHVNDYAPLQNRFDLDTYRLRDLKDGPLTDKNLKRVNPEHGDLQVIWEDKNLWVKPNAFYDLLGLEIPITGIGRYDFEGPQYAKEAYHVVWFGSETHGFTDNGLVLAATHQHGLVHLYQIRRDEWPRLKIICFFQGHTGTVTDMAVDGNRLYTCSLDQTIRIWPLPSDDDLQNLEETVFKGDKPVAPILNFYFTRDGEWVVWSNAGYYDASPNGDKLIGFHVNRGNEKPADFYPVDRFAEQLYKPDLIREILAEGDEETVLKRHNLGHANLETILNYLPPEIIFKKIEVEKEARDTVTLSFRVENENPQENPLTGVSIALNQQPLLTWPEGGDSNGAQQERVVHFDVGQILLEAGQNEIMITAQSLYSASKPLLLRVKSREKNPPIPIMPNLYLIAIGVSNYQHGVDRSAKTEPQSGTLFNLKYADKDAAELVNQFKSLGGYGFKKVLPALLTDELATKENIEFVVKKLGERLRARSARLQQKNMTARDVVVVFFAGHGIKHEEDFYFLNHDFVPGKIRETAIKITDIGTEITRYPAELVLMTDACHAGQIGHDFNNREMTKRWEGIQKDRAQVIFNATTAGAVAVERAIWGHGAFSKGVIDTLSEAEDLSVLRFIDLVIDKVETLTERRQTPTVSLQGATRFKLKEKRKKG